MNIENKHLQRETKILIYTEIFEGKNLTMKSTLNRVYI